MSTFSATAILLFFLQLGGYKYPVCILHVPDSNDPIGNYIVVVQRIWIALNECQVTNCWVELMPQSQGAYNHMLLVRIVGGPCFSMSTISGCF